MPAQEEEDEDIAFVPLDLLELFEILEWEAALKEVEHGEDQ